MIWRVVVVVICILIVVSAVWAASNSFEVRVDGPNTFGATVIIPTPTPVSRPVSHSFRMNHSEGQGKDTVHVDMPLPNDFVVLMQGNRVDELKKFHLCHGALSRCTGGILSLDANYIDRQGDGIADLLRVVFDRDDFENLLSNATNDTTGDVAAEATSSATGVSGSTTSTQEVGTFEPTTTSGVGETPADASTDSLRRVRLTISGELYAWKIAQP